MSDQVDASTSRPRMDTPMTSDQLIVTCRETAHSNLTRFWGDRESIDLLETRIEKQEKPLAILERLGPSPFERGGFPLIGFLATAYEKVSRFAHERRGDKEITGSVLDGRRDS